MEKMKLRQLLRVIDLGVRFDDAHYIIYSDSPTITHIEFLIKQCGKSELYKVIKGILNGVLLRLQEGNHERIM